MTIKVIDYKAYGHKERTYTGELDELVNEVFGYTLTTGKAYENDYGNKPVKDNPSTAEELITALENASYNICAMPKHYEIIIG